MSSASPSPAVSSRMTGSASNRGRMSGPASLAASVAGSHAGSAVSTARKSSARSGAGMLKSSRGGGGGEEASSSSSSSNKKEKKTKHALTPAEKRALLLRKEQEREEAEAARKEKEKRIAAKRAARTQSATSSRGGADSIPASGRDSRRSTTMDGDDVELVEQPDGTFIATHRGEADAEADAEADLLDEAEIEAALAAEEESKKKAEEEENFDIVFDGPKSPLIMATAAKEYHEIHRLIQEVPIEYRVEFVNEYDDHGCSALFFAIGPEHQECMQLLLDYGSDPNHQNNKKNTPLHIACAIQNKKACRVLIEHGANIQLENWQYQKPHEMVPERDKVSSTQAFLNSCQEALVEKVAAKTLPANVTRAQRSYYRSIYDIADKDEIGALKYDVIESLLTNLHLDSGSQHLTQGNIDIGDGLARPDPKWLFGFFSSWDSDKNGLITFNEWLLRIMAWQADREKLRKKLKRKAMLAAKRKKKREMEAAKKAAQDAAEKQAQQEAAVANVTTEASSSSS